MKVAVVIPCGENRLENLVECVRHLSNQTRQIDNLVIVCDGFASHKAIDSLIIANLWLSNHNESSVNKIKIIESPKHVGGSGTLQPKNYGAAFVTNNYPDIDYLWFVDSDIIVEETTLESYQAANQLDENRILIGPYEWLPSGVRKLSPEIKNDPRWGMFEEYGSSYTSVGEIHYALANFGGNIMYPVKEFTRVGGFWDELSAGRAEDGEMGLRCASMGIPMAVVPDARGYHLDHPVNHQWKIDTNAVEVPMINERHPWVQDEGIIVVDKDGKRFDWVNPETGKSVNTLEIWNYKRRKVSE